MSDGDEYSFENLVLEGLVFMLLVTSKLKLKDFSSYSKYLNVIHEYSLKATKTFL